MYSDVMIVVFTLDSISIQFFIKNSILIPFFSPQYSELKI